MEDDLKKEKKLKATSKNKWIEDDLKKNEDDLKKIKMETTLKKMKWRQP